MTSEELCSLTEIRAFEHKTCAEMAEKAELFNSAVSRYYYYCLMLAKAYIIKKEKVYFENYFQNKTSHSSMGVLFQTVAYEHSPSEYTDVSSELDLDRLKPYRVKADYQGSVCYNKKTKIFQDFRNLVIEFEQAINDLN